jgi:hypothetical protein
MTQMGIPVAEFNRRVRRLAGPVYSSPWIFEDILPPTGLLSDEKYDDLRQGGLVVGRVIRCLGNQAIFMQSNPSSHRRFEEVKLSFPDEDTAKPWKQMAGVALALLTEPSESSPDQQEFTVNEVIGVEPPITDIWYSADASLDPGFGYVHGILRGNGLKIGRNGILDLWAPRQKNVRVNCNHTPLAIDTEGNSRHEITDGDILRIDVLGHRPGSPINRTAFDAARTIHVLGNVASLR